MPTAIHSLDDMLAYLSRHTDYERQQGGRARDIFDLERMNEVLNRLARPELACATAHVAGTKGKGSTSRMLAEMLSSQGLKTGLFTSPHLERLTQRIEINGEEISERAMVEAFQVVVNAIESEPGGAPDITFFELLTLTSMVAFQRAGVDVAVFEVGLGGRLDSTNVISPEVCVITEIGLDHTRQLGETIAEIAREKAGIIKPGVPVVCGASDPEAIRVITLTARDQEAPLLLFGRDYKVREFKREGRGIRFTVRTRDDEYADVLLNNPARHMADNAAHALCALEVMMSGEWMLTGGVLDKDRALDALARVKLPGRLEIFEGDPLLVIDSAHNEVSLRAGLKTARELCKGRGSRDGGRGSRLVCVMGLASDKDVEACMKPVAEFADAAIFTTYYNPRQSRPEDLLRVYEKFGGRGGVTDEHPEAALETALDAAGDEGLVLVTGSTYLAGLMIPAAREYGGKSGEEEG